jgi:hypothetical protein
MRALGQAGALPLIPVKVGSMRMSRIFAAALLGAFVMTVMAAPAEKLTRRKLESFAELDRVLGVATASGGSEDSSLRGQRR